MAKQIKKDNLGYLGEDFQQELVKMFIEDQVFFANIEPIVDQNKFTNDTLIRIVGLMKDYYAISGVVPTYKTLDSLIRNKVTDAISTDRCIAMLESFKDLETRGIDIIEGYAENFFKQQNITKALNRGLEIVKDGDFNNYDQIEEILKKALEANNTKDGGFHIFDNWEAALEDSYRITIPTGAKDLDDALYGGLGKGELGIIIAPSSVGKTSATTGFAAMAAVAKTEDNNYQGYKVLHFFFEDEEVNIKRKYYARLTGFDACELSRPDIRPMVVDMIQRHEWKDMIQHNVIGYHLLSGENSPTDIKTIIKKELSKGFKPDLVIIDYFECLKLERGSSIEDKEYTREGITMRKLEAIAHEFNIALWCPVQGTKDSFNQQIVGMSQAGGSVKKVQIGHVIISFARTEQMRLQDKLNIFINKFRPGRIKRNEFLNVTFNNGTTEFDFSTVSDVDETIDGSSAYQQDMAQQAKRTYR